MSGLTCFPSSMLMPTYDFQFPIPFNTENPSLAESSALCSSADKSVSRNSSSSLAWQDSRTTKSALLSPPDLSWFSGEAGEPRLSEHFIDGKACQRLWPQRRGSGRRPVPCHQEKRGSYPAQTSNTIWGKSACPADLS